MDVIFEINTIKFDKYPETRYEDGCLVSVNSVTGVAFVKVGTGEGKTVEEINIDDIVEVRKSAKDDSNLTIMQQSVIANKMFGIADKYGQRFIDNLVALDYNYYEIATLPGNDLVALWEMYVWMNMELEKEYLAEEESYTFPYNMSDSVFPEYENNPGYFFV